MWPPQTAFQHMSSLRINQRMLQIQHVGSFLMAAGMNHRSIQVNVQADIFIYSLLSLRSYCCRLVILSFHLLQLFCLLDNQFSLEMHNPRHQSSRADQVSSIQCVFTLAFIQSLQTMSQFLAPKHPWTPVTSKKTPVTSVQQHAPTLVLMLVFNCQLVSAELRYQKQHDQFSHTLSHSKMLQLTEAAWVVCQKWCYCDKSCTMADTKLVEQQKLNLLIITNKENEIFAAPRYHIDQ